MTDQGDHINLCKADADMLDRLVSVGFELDQLEGLSTEEATACHKHFTHVWPT